MRVLFQYAALHVRLQFLEGGTSHVRLCSGCYDDTCVAWLKGVSSCPMFRSGRTGCCHVMCLDLCISSCGMKVRSF